MEIKITSGLIGVLIALLLILLYVSYDGFKRSELTAIKINEIHSLLTDPNVTNIK